MSLLILYRSKIQVVILVLMTKKHERTFNDYLELAWYALVLIGIGIVMYIVVPNLIIKHAPKQNSNTPVNTNTPASTQGNYDSNGSDDYEESRGSDDCTEDCSGHEAGYEWAKDNDICDTDYDEGNSDSFNEGVVAWAEDNC